MTILDPEATTDEQVFLSFAITILFLGVLRGINKYRQGAL